MADGFFGKVKMLIGVEDEDPEEEIIYEDPAPVRRQPRTPVVETRPAGFDFEDRGRASYTPPRTEPRESKVLNMNSNPSSTTMSKRQPQQQNKLISSSPKSFNDCPELVDHIRDKRPVIINLEQLPSEEARRIFDFLSGAIYALDGKVQKVSESIFIFAPENVEVFSRSDKGRMGTIGDSIFNK